MDEDVVAQLLVKLDLNWILRHFSSDRVRMVKCVTYAKESSSVSQVPVLGTISPNPGFERDFISLMVKFRLQAGHELIFGFRRTFIFEYFRNIFF